MVTLLKNGRSIIVFDCHFKSRHRGNQGKKGEENHFHFQLNQLSLSAESALTFTLNFSSALSDTFGLRVGSWFDQSWCPSWSLRCILRTGEKFRREGLGHFGGRWTVRDGALGVWTSLSPPFLWFLGWLCCWCDSLVRCWRNMLVAVVVGGESSSSTANNLIFLPPFLCGYYVQSSDTVFCMYCG